MLSNRYHTTTDKNYYPNFDNMVIITSYHNCILLEDAMENKFAKIAIELHSRAQAEVFVEMWRGHGRPKNYSDYIIDGAEYGIILIENVDPHKSTFVDQFTVKEQSFKTKAQC